MADADTRSSRRADVAFAIAMIGVAAVTIFEARRQPRSPFDPVGAAAVPMWTAYLMIALAAVLLLRLALGRSTAGSAQMLFVGLVKEEELDYRLYPRLAVVAFLLCVGYVAIIPLVGFAVATFVFMLSLGWALGAPDPRRLIGTAVLALIAAVANDYIFRRLVLLDLP